MILLPICAYVLLAMALARNAEGGCWGTGFVKAHLVVFGFVAVSTELLSAWNALTFSGVLGAWVMFLSTCVLFAVRQVRTLPWPPGPRASPVQWVLAGVMGAALVTTLVTALVYPPNNWDSMTYHLPRVAHWMAQRNLSFFPTATTRQIYQMPLAEFAILHLQLLAGSDVYAGLVQWISFGVTLCLAALVAHALGLAGPQQWLSAAIVATLPMALLQASSTQNDLVVAAFVVAFAFFMLRLREGLALGHAAFAALSLGLALMTKGTAFLFCAGMGTALALPIVATHGFKHASRRLLGVVVASLLLGAPHLARNHALFGTPLPTSQEDYLNGELTSAAWASNMVRNIALHLGTPDRMFNRRLSLKIRAGLGGQANNPRTTYEDTQFGIPYTQHEDTAGNLLHMLLVLLSVLILPFWWARGRYRSAVPYALGLASGALLYCLLLKWQPWASRLHMPLFVLAAPLLSMTIASPRDGARNILAYGMLAVMVFHGSSSALENESRPLASGEWRQHKRLDLYFNNRLNLRRDYLAAMTLLERVEGDVGLLADDDDWEYPLWLAGGNHTFRHVGVTNVSRSLDDERVLPTHVVATRPWESWEHAHAYKPLYQSPSISVLQRVGSAVPPQHP